MGLATEKSYARNGFGFLGIISIGVDGASFYMTYHKRRTWKLKSGPKK